jgi:lysophospholipase L1-like esterase
MDPGLLQQNAPRAAKAVTALAMVSFIPILIWMVLRKARKFAECKGNLALILGIFTPVYLLVCSELIFTPHCGASYGIWDPYAVHPSFGIRDREFGYVLRPNIHTPDKNGTIYTINSGHLRGAEIPPKAENAIRVVCIGDSVTFGWNLLDNETYPHFLEQRLRQMDASRKWEVINAGVPSYTSFQHLKMCELWVPKLKADIVLICSGWNDISFAFSDPWNPKDSFYNNQFLTTFSPAIFRALKGAFLKPVNPEFTRPNPAAISSFEQNLVRMVEVLRRYGIQVLLLEPPTVVSRKAMTIEEMQKGKTFLKSIDTIEDYQKTVRKISQEKKTALIPDPYALQESGKNRYFLDHCHLSPEGADRLAKHVASFLLRSYLSGQPDR